MAGRFSETNDWRGPAWALSIWAAHFSVLWGASSIFPASATARWIALGATLVAFAALAMLWRARSTRSDCSILTVAIGVAALAILFGAMPALVG